MRGTIRPLQFVTYLSPSLPVEFFERVAHQVGATIGRDYVVTSNETVSGPRPDNGVMFDEDVAFVCAPSAGWLAASGRANIVAAPVFEHPRAGGRPVYFSDVIVRLDDPATSADDLSGSVWGVNDTSSLSGYYSVLRAFAAPPPLRVTGSHMRSIDAVMSGEVRAAAIDSTVMALAAAATPALLSGLRVVASLGPFPVQPVVVSTQLDASVIAAIREALLTLGETRAGARILASIGARGFVPVEASLYQAESDAAGAAASG